MRIIVKFKLDQWNIFFFPMEKLGCVQRQTRLSRFVFNFHEICAHWDNSNTVCRGFESMVTGQHQLL